MEPSEKNEFKHIHFTFYSKQQISLKKRGGGITNFKSNFGKDLTRGMGKFNDNFFNSGNLPKSRSFHP